MIAFFPGKFQPPHLGHVLTIVNLYSDFDRVVVGVTDDSPSLLQQLERVQILSEVFQHMPKVRVVPVKGILVKYENLDGLPDFDICLSGNPDVIKKMVELGKKCKFVSRSKGIGYSGTEQRGLFNKNEA